MSNMEERLLKEILLQTYRDIAPEHSVDAEFLIRKLATGLFQRGGRISLGSTTPPKLQHLHISVDANDRIVWTDKELHQRLGYRPHSLIGKHVDSILSEGSIAFRREFGLSELLREGRLGPVPITFIRGDGGLLVGSVTSQVLRDSNGDFLRTFSRIVVPLMILAMTRIRAC